MDKIQIADVCFHGPEERIINAVKISIKDKLKLEFPNSEKKTVKNIMKIILNNEYCTKEEIIEITMNNKKIEINDNTIEKEIDQSKENINIIEIQLDEESLSYYKGCVFYKIIEGYPEDYFLDIELEK